MYDRYENAACMIESILIGAEYRHRYNLVSLKDKTRFVEIDPFYIRHLRADEYQYLDIGVVTAFRVMMKQRIL